MFSAYRQSICQFNRNVRLFLLTTILIGFGYMGVYLMLFNLYLLRLGYGPAFIGLVNGAAQITMALFSLPGGVLGRRWGNRRMLIIGLSILGVGLGGLPLAEFMPAARQAGWLVTSYVVAYLGAALYIVNSNPFLMNITSPAERDHVFSVREACFPLAAFAGSLAGGLLPGLLAPMLGVSLAQPAPYRLALFIAVGLLMPGVFALRATRNVSAEESRSEQWPRPQPSLSQNQEAIAAPVGLMIFLALVILPLVAGSSVVNIFFNVYLDTALGISTTGIGVLMAIGKLLSGPAALITPLLIVRWGRMRTILGGFAGTTVALLPLALIPYWSAAGLGFIGVNALFICTIPAFTICQQEIVPPAWRSTMSGAIAMAMGIGTAIAAFGGGYLITTFGYASLFLAGAGLTALGTLLFWACTWLPRWVIIRRAALKRQM